MAQVIDFQKAQAAQQFKRDLAEALRPKRMRKATKRALVAQEVRLRAAQSL